MKGIIDNVIWLKKSPQVLEVAKEHFEKRLYKEKGCSRCEYMPERHTEVCDECPNYLGHFRLWEKKKKNGKKYVGFASGSRSLLKRQFPKITIVKDIRGAAKMDNPIKFTGTLRPEQKEAVAKMSKKRYGLLEAPPRTGKTVIAIAVACKLGYKTLILANQHEFLSQFLETIVGSKKNGVKALTNANKFSDDGPVVGLCKVYSDFEHNDICLATYQTFLSPKGQKLLKRIRRMFGFVIVDEAHKVAANSFIKVINKFSAKFRMGVTATPDRKDMKHVLTEQVLGPVIHVIEKETMIPRLVIIETPAKTHNKYKTWVGFENFLFSNTERNALIIKHAVEDIRQGRSIVIPTPRIGHVHELVKGINKKLREPLAVAFTGQQNKLERDTIRQKAINGTIQCVVGIRQLVQLGINIPRWDTIYEVAPISNIPNAKQELSRIRTQMEGKREPLVKHFIEDMPQSKGCFRTTYWGNYVPEKFIIDSKNERLAKKYLAAKTTDYSEKKSRFKW